MAGEEGSSNIISDYPLGVGVVFVPALVLNIVMVVVGFEFGVDCPIDTVHQFLQIGGVVMLGFTILLFLVASVASCFSYREIGIKRSNIIVCVGIIW